MRTKSATHNNQPWTQYCDL